MCEYVNSEKLRDLFIFKSCPYMLEQTANFNLLHIVAAAALYRTLHVGQCEKVLNSIFVKSHSLT